MPITTTSKTSASVDSIELLPDHTVMIVCDDQSVAKQFLKRNPRCRVVHGEDGDERVALVYSADDYTPLHVVKRA